MPIKQFNIFKEFAEIAETYFAKPAIIFDVDQSSEKLTYTELYKRSVQVSHWLQKEGVGSSDKVAIVLNNRPEYAFCFLGIMNAGAVAVPLDIQFPPEQIAKIIAHSKAKLIITDEKLKSLFKSLIKGVSIVSVDNSDFRDNLSKFPEHSTEENLSFDDSLATLFYTSGTTDLPKAVMLSHKNILSNALSIRDLRIVVDKDKVISLLPLHHTYSFTVTLLIPLLSGATVVFPSGLSSSELLSCLKEEKISIFVGVPQLFSLIDRSINGKIEEFSKIKKNAMSMAREIFYALRKLTKINISKLLFADIHKSFGGHLRIMVSGGARLDPQIAKNFTKWGFTVLEGYGLTETSPVSAFNPVNNPQIGSVGKALPGVEVKIYNPDSEGIGEVIISGPNVMLGYYQQEESTQNVIKDNWFYSGDLGYIDKRGYLYLTGRKKGIIVLSSGKNINPEDLESYYSQSPYIKEICVMAMQKEGFLAGVEHLVAVVAAEEKSFPGMDSSQIKNIIRQELNALATKVPSYKHVSGFLVIHESLPRTALGKIQRYKVEEIFSQLQVVSKKVNEKLNEEDTKIFNAGISKAARKALKKIIKKDVSFNDHLELDLGLDSLSRIDVLLNLQDSLGLKMTDDQAMDFFVSSTVKDLLLKLIDYFPDGKVTISEDTTMDWDEIIKQNPSEKTLRKIKVRSNIFVQCLNILIFVLLKVFFKIFFFLRVEGKEYIRGNGPYLICPNHASYLDAFVLISALPIKIALNTQFVGYSYLFEKFPHRHLVKMGSIIPIDADTNMIEALRACAYALRQSRIVCYFPEGQRCFDGKLDDFKSGVGILIKELNIPVTPVSIEGTFKAWPRGKKFPCLTSLKCKFGPMVDLDALVSKNESDGETYSLIAQNLREKVEFLSKN